MTITPEEAIKWHEQRAAEAHAGLSCGSENSEYRAADKVAEMHRMAARALAENERLREIISRCAASLGNGAAIMPTCTVEFMAELPREIELVTSDLRSELSTAYRCGRKDMREEAAGLLDGIEPDEDAAGCPASWGDFVQVAQSAIRKMEA